MESLPRHHEGVKLVIALRCKNPPKLLQYLVTGTGLNPKPFHRATPPKTWSEAPSFLRKLKFPIYAEEADFYCFYPATYNLEHHEVSAYFRTVGVFDQQATQRQLEYFREYNLELPTPDPPTWMVLYSPSPEALLDPKLSAQINAWLKPPFADRSVGLTRKFAYLYPRIMEPMKADGLLMRDIEVYRIIYTFRKYPEKSRIRAKGKGPLYPLPYTITYQSQIADYLKVRRRDLLATAMGARRYQARKMGTSPKTVKRAIHRLCEAGWIARVYPGRPKDCPWLSPQAQERRDQRHERVPQWGPQKYMLATDKYQRDGIKGIYRKLKELGLPPYLIYLPGHRF